MMLLVLLIPTLAQAALSFRPVSPEESHDLSLAAGITAPSAVGSIFENPAGLVYTHRPTVTLSAELPDGTLQNPREGLAVQFGDATFGAAAGVVSHPATGYFGLGIQSPELKMSLGVIGIKDFLAGLPVVFNLGVIVGPVEKFSIGFSTMNFLQQGREWGLGMAYDFAPTFSFATDLGMSHDLTSKWIQPGIIARTQSASLAVSYGFGLGDAQTLGNVNNGVVIGASIKPSPMTGIEFYYKRLSASYGYYAGFSLAFK